jgi:FKBP-type peptidyl-prolyl cis-trans isomerase FkpA/FKBP-type peptidyl-prolyl cis-trans isomerase FklB
MRRITPWSLAGLLLVATPLAAAGPELKTEEQKTLYTLGIAISRNLTTFNLTEAELEVVKAGISDGVLRKDPRIDINAYGPKLQEFQQGRASAGAAGEKKAAQGFLDKAAAEKGAAKTASGLIITALIPGTGASPKATDTVKVHYHGTLTDGTVFDSSVLRREPATFALNAVIPCWTEAVQMMKVGGKSRLVCPSTIAYGDRGAPPRIKPGAALVFEVELFDIVKK